jgi:hypothetical protein
MTNLVTYSVLFWLILGGAAAAYLLWECHRS